MKLIEQTMGWTRTDESNGDRKWITHTGEFSSGAEVDDILSWFRHKGYEFSSNQRLTGEYLVALDGKSITIFMAGPTLKQALALAAQEVPSWE